MIWGTPRPGKASACSLPNRRQLTHRGDFDMGGRPTKGWIFVAPAAVKTKRQLRNWVRRGVQLAHPPAEALSSGAAGTGHRGMGDSKISFSRRRSLRLARRFATQVVRRGFRTFVRGYDGERVEVGRFFA
jgi:hypothetical protein